MGHTKFSRCMWSTLVLSLCLCRREGTLGNTWDTGVEYPGSSFLREVGVAAGRNRVVLLPQQQLCLRTLSGWQEGAEGK